MRYLQILSSAAALAHTAIAQADSNMTKDALTGITYSSYTNPVGITFGVALPLNVTDPYDAIISISAPVANATWAGFAWGGTMVFNPLTVGWPNGTSAVASSRFAFGFSLPQAYDGAEYTYLKKGTHSNSTHWTVTAKCSGCTSWSADDGSWYVLNGTGTVPFAWAQGLTAVVTPSSNTSVFNVHEAFGKWNHDLNAARSSKFHSWVERNL